MATRQQILSAILRVAGNPESGNVKALAPAMADAIVALDETPAVVSDDKKAKPVAKETRIIEAQETR
jgi:hypothetical protein